MSHAKETPRQKMMGILYLVLLGIAATTITDHVLDAFSSLTQSLQTSTKNVQTTVEGTFSAFEATKLKSDPVRNQPIYDRAKKIRQYVDDLNGFINHIKDTLIAEGGGINSDGDLKAKDDIDISPRMMVRKGGDNSLSRQLKAKINETRKDILETLDPSEKQGLNFSLNAEDPPKKGDQPQVSWEEDNFGDGIPLVAAITALTKVQSDLKNSESDVIGRVLSADKTQIVLDRFEAVAVAPTSYVFVGEPYKADVFLTASSSTSNPDIVIDGQQLKVTEGKGEYTVVPQSEGEKKWSGVIRVKQEDNSIKEYKLPEQSYTVARPSATISPDSLNVFYIGIDNPLSVSVPGIANDKVHVSMSAGGITGGNGNYIVKINQAVGKITVTASGELSDGKSRTMGTKVFRVKRVPAPIVKFGGKAGGRASSVLLKSQNRIFAVLEDFEFNAPFTIQKFTMFVSKPHSDVTKLDASTNGTLTPQMMDALHSITSGTRIIFDNVEGVGVDGMKRQLNPIVFTVE